MVSQLERLAKPFPARLIHENPSGGGSYVKHSVVTEKLLAVVGPFSFELVEVIRGDVAGIEPNPQGKSARAKAGRPGLVGCVVGAVCRLVVTVDCRDVHIDEVGDCEDPHNWPHDGARLKDAMSDALKRAAMRLGVTLHLWSGPEFSLYEQLSQSGSLGEHPRAEPAGTVGAPTVPATSPNRRAQIKARCVALQADRVSVADARAEWQLPKVDECDDRQLGLWEELLAELEGRLEAPFEAAK